MQLISLYTLLLLGLAAVASAITIPEGSPDGIYFTTFNETGHEVTDYYSSHEEYSAASKRSLSFNPREFLSARAAAPPLDKRQEGSAACSVYTGINYAPAVGGLALTCGISTSFRYSIAFQLEGALAYGCDYGNGNSCDVITIEGLNEQLDEFCGPYSNAWYNIPEYALSFGRTQGGTCYCWC